MRATDARPSGRIKVVQFVTSFEVGGTERQVVNLARAVDASRFDLRLACLRDTGLFRREVEASHLPVSEYPAKNLKVIHERLRFARHLRRDGVHIVHAFNFYPNLFAVPAAWLARTPVVVASIRLTEGVLTPVERRVQRLVCALAHCILANAEAVRQWLIADGYDPAKIVVIRNGIDLARFQGPPSDGRLRAWLGVPHPAPLVAMISRLVPSKGIDVFVDAAAMVAARVPDARFVVVGDPQAAAGRDYQRELERRAAGLGIGGRIAFTGQRTDTPELLAESTVSVLASFSEGLSNVLLESMAAGVPVVATTVGGNAEVVEEGVTGFLVPPRAPTALAQAICGLLENPDLARRFGDAGRRRVATHFSLDRLARETEELYLQLLTETGCRRAGDRPGRGAPAAAVPVEPRGWRGHDH